MTKRLFLTVGCALLVFGTVFYLVAESSKLLALAGNVGAQRKMGDIAANEQRYDDAAYWYRRAIEQDDVQSYARLGNMFFKGVVKPLNDYEGFRGYMHAVQKEIYKAQPAFCRYATYGADHKLTEVDKAVTICGKGYRPLVLDLDGNGIQIRGAAEKHYVYFDIADNKFAVLTDWLDGKDGFLVVDKNDNGYIDSGAEMVAGYVGGAANGFVALAAYDSDGDGKITPQDKAWKDLRVWIDKAPYGFVRKDQGGELWRLEDLDISSISLDYKNIDDSWGETAIWQSSKARVGNRDVEIASVRFWTKGLYSEYTPDVDIPAALNHLPNINGQGYLKELRTQMALDRQNKVPKPLEILVYRLYVTPIEDLFLPSNNLEEQIINILFRWGGVDDIDPTSRGKNIDARALAFLELLTANKFLQRGVTFNPRPHAALDLKDAFGSLYAGYSGALLSQGEGKKLFSGSYVYFDSRNDRIRGATGLDAAVLGKLTEIAKSLPDRSAREIFWGRVILLVRSVFKLVTHAEVYMDLMQAIKASDANLDPQRMIKAEISYVNLPLVDPEKQAGKAP